MATISERIKEGLSIRNMKQVDLVEKTGINKGALSSYISGKYEPKQKNIYLIANALDVNEAWLMGCDVPMDKTVTLNNQNATQDELLLLNNYKKLNEQGKREANKRVAELTEISRYLINDEIVATKDNYLMPVAAHDDELTDDEKDFMQKCIEKYEKNK